MKYGDLRAIAAKTRGWVVYGTILGVDDPHYIRLVVSDLLAYAGAHPPDDESGLQLRQQDDGDWCLERAD